MSFAFKFGTAGIRARLGPNHGELNLDSVRVIAHAITQTLATLSDDARARGLAVAFDGRHESRSFAEEVCRVALAEGFHVGLFERETPTPLLAFATRSLGKLAGIMVTASHNPAHDNGIKLYLEGGRQVSAPHDARIEALIERAPDPALIARDDLDSARRAGRLTTLGERELGAYLASIRGLLPRPHAPVGLRFGYTALYGVGAPVTRRLVAELDGLDCVEVAAEVTLRADFGGLSSPNPEEPHALSQLKALMEREHLDLGFAHDPDADRLAVVTRDTRGALHSLSGDEVGALLGDFLLSQHPHPEGTLLMSTLVSGGLLEQIARSYGASFARSKTGFKWIAALGRERARSEQRELLFGYEEALGYAFFAMADDKDGIAALAVLCTLARGLAAQGKSVRDQLAALEEAHGVFVTRQLSLVAQGADGPERIAQCMQRLRSLAPSALLGPAPRLTDYESGPDAFPLLVFEDASQTRVCVRPSGTEPKLKVYLHARELAPRAEQDTERPAALALARTRAEARLDALESALTPFLVP